MVNSYCCFVSASDWGVEWAWCEFVLSWHRFDTRSADFCFLFFFYLFLYWFQKPKHLFKENMQSKLLKVIVKDSLIKMPLHTKLSLFAYVISGERSANRPKQLRNDAFHVKASQSAKNWLDPAKNENQPKFDIRPFCTSSPSFIIHQTHYEKSDWSRAFNQFKIACELDMINAISAADIAFINNNNNNNFIHSCTYAWLLSPLECVILRNKMAERFASVSEDELNWIMWKMYNK